MNATKQDEFTVDDLGFIHIAPTKVLAAVARGEVDLNAIARRELANRGLDMHGRWVGFEQAARLATYFVHRIGGKLTYVSVPGRSESLPARTRYVIRDNDGLYVVAFDNERRAISLCDNIEQAKRFGSHLAADRFRRKHAGRGYGLSDAAVIVPIGIGRAHV